MDSRSLRPLGPPPGLPAAPTPPPQQLPQQLPQQAPVRPAVLPVAEETIDVATRSVDRGGVRVSVAVHEERHAIDLPLAREEVEVQRVPIDRFVTEAPNVRQEGDTTIVPLVEEVLVVEKRLLLREEVHLTRRRSVERESRTVPLRREEATVERLAPEPSPSPVAATGPGAELGPELEPEQHPAPSNLSPSSPSHGGPTMDTTIVGLFDTHERARQVKAALHQAGFREADVRLMSQYDERGQAVRDPDKGFWESLKDAFGFGDDDREEYGTYAEGARRGGVLVAVDASGNEADRAANILAAHGAVDIDRRAQEWRSSGWSGYDANAAALSADELERERARYQADVSTRQQGVQQGQHQNLQANQGTIKVPVIEEELAAGKRRIDRGGVRIYRRTTERPVEANVNLREERVRVERRPVDRELRPGEAQDAFAERTIEARESGEEAVVQKKARVVEEVEVGKDVEQRQETVRDTVRRTDVEVERLPGEAARTTETERTEVDATRADANRNRTTKP